MKLLATIIQRTPLWAWALLALLIYRGVVALKSREQSQTGLLLMPFLLSVWGIASFWRQLAVDPTTLLFWGAGLSAGFSVGLWLQRKKGRYNRKTNRFERDGSVLPLFLFIAIFTFQYIASVVLAIAPALYVNHVFRSIFIGVSGFFFGVLWGETARLLARKYRLPRIGK